MMKLNRLGFIILCFGVFICAAIIISALSGYWSLRIIMPGEVNIVLPKAGEYTVSYEYKSKIGNKKYNTPQNIPSLEYTLCSKTTGKRIDLITEKWPIKYTEWWGWGCAGMPILKFTIEQPDTYFFLGEYNRESVKEKVVIRIEYGLMEISNKIMIALFIAVISAMLMVILNYRLIIYMDKKLISKVFSKKNEING